jgi:hypothetical protein
VPTTSQVALVDISCTNWENADKICTPTTEITGEHVELAQTLNKPLTVGVNEVAERGTETVGWTNVNDALHVDVTFIVLPIK